MKLVKITFFTAAIALSAAAYSQTDTTHHPMPGKPDTARMPHSYTSMNVNVIDTGKPKPKDTTQPMYSYASATINDVADTAKKDTVKSSLYNYASFSYAVDTPKKDTTKSIYSFASMVTTDTTGDPQMQVAPQPNFGRYYIPVLGSYTSSADQKNVTIQGDEQNAGKIWIEGLTSEKIYALRKAPAGTYKIPAQKSGDQNVAEGTVLYDDNSKEVRICIGHKYVDDNPSEAFNDQSTADETTTSKKHKAVEKATPMINYSGTKANSGTASII